MTDIPDARPDGKCAECQKKPAETKDGRFCKSCLKKFVNHLNPMIGCYKGMYRTPEHRQAKEVDGALDNGIRALEGD